MLRRTYSGEVAIQDAKYDDTDYGVHADHTKEEGAAAKSGDDDHVGNTEVSDKDGRAQLADKARGVYNYELESRC